MDPNSTVVQAQKLAYEDQMYNLVVDIDSIYNYSSVVIISLGLMGNLLGSILLCLSPLTQTTHFVYYKTLTLMELLYCVNFLVVKLISHFCMAWYPQHEFIFLSYFAACYILKISRLVNSTTGYTVMYTSILIMGDRIQVLRNPTEASSSDKSRRASIVMVGIVLLSMLIHSWDTAFENFIDTVDDGNGSFYYVGSQRIGPIAYTAAAHAKDIYNTAVRWTYPVQLFVLSTVLIVKYAKYLRKKATLTNRAPTRHERDRDFLIIMLAVIVIFALVQVTPNEINRIIGMIGGKVMDAHEALDENVTLVEFKRVVDTLVQNRLLSQLGNFTTCCDRSFKVYCYVLFNRLFRGEFIKLIKCQLNPRRSSSSATITFRQRSSTKTLSRVKRPTNNRFRE